jgi:hypothetical protein
MRQLLEGATHDEDIGARSHARRDEIARQHQSHGVAAHALGRGSSVRRAVFFHWQLGVRGRSGIACVQRIEDGTHALQELSSSSCCARAGHDRRKARGFWNGTPPMSRQWTSAPRRAIARSRVEAKARSQHLERHACADVE